MLYRLQGYIEKSISCTDCAVSDFNKPDTRSKHDKMWREKMLPRELGVLIKFPKMLHVSENPYQDGSPTEDFIQSENSIFEVDGPAGGQGEE